MNATEAIEATIEARNVADDVYAEAVRPAQEILVEARAAAGWFTFDPDGYNVDAVTTADGTFVLERELDRALVRRLDDYNCPRLRELPHVEASGAEWIRLEDFQVFERTVLAEYLHPDSPRRLLGELPDVEG
jgi:hypothetical protein